MPLKSWLFPDFTALYFLPYAWGMDKVCKVFYCQVHGCLFVGRLWPVNADFFQPFEMDPAWSCPVRFHTVHRCFFSFRFCHRQDRAYSHCIGTGDSPTAFMACFINWIPRASGTCSLQTPISIRISFAGDCWFVLCFGASGMNFTSSGLHGNYVAIC